MRDLEIYIKKARIKSFTVELNEDLPNVNATIGLYSENGEKVAEYLISTSPWMDESKQFKLNPDIIQNILGIAYELEKVVTDHCKNRQLQLTEGGEK